MARRFSLLDTFPDFSEYWDSVRLKPLDEKILAWQLSYMDKYPELFEKQVSSYRNNNVDWHRVARHVLPAFEQNLVLMKKASKNILNSYDEVCSLASETLLIDFDVLIVIYVGIGCGAGWATTYSGKPSILMGLENIAEEAWHTPDKLRGLISHEIGHLAHINWRNNRGEFFSENKDPVIHLYIEGFAQRCEGIITSGAAWHMAPDDTWLSWCETNRNRLAAEFLTRVNGNLQVRDFFGSWFEIEGRKQTGYFLGHAFISELEKTISLREIAALPVDEIRRLAIDYLKSISQD